MSRIDDALREELTALLDDALPEERAAELRARMETDDALRREFDELERTVAMVRALPRERAPAALRERLRVAVQPARAPAPIFRWVGSLAAAAAVAGVALFLVRSQDPEPSPDVFTEARRDVEIETPETPLEARFEQPAPAQAPADGGRDRAKAGLTVAAKRGYADAREEAQSEVDDDAGEAAESMRRLGLKKGVRLRAVEDREKETVGDLGKTMLEVELKSKDNEFDVKKLLRSVEHGASIQGALREPYFVKLDASESEVVVNHIDALAPMYTRGEKAGQLPTVYVANVTEAKQVRSILMRAYPILRQEASNAARTKNKVRGRAAPSLAGAVASATRTELRIEVEANDHELAQLRSWLFAISLPENPKGGRAGKAQRKRQGSAATVRFQSKVPAGKKSLPRKRYRIRIVMPQKPGVPATEATPKSDK